MKTIETDKSLISRRDSTLLKGILIILIILGHNGILMGKAPGLTVTSLNYYLYSFHVQLFLILPFLYNTPLFTKERIKKDFIHLFKPYTFLFATFLLINITLLKQDFNPIDTAAAYIAGNQPLLKNAIGVYFPWFLPSMFSLLLLRNYILNKSTIVILLSVVLSLALFAAIKIFNFRINIDFLGLVTAATYFSIAVISRYLYERFYNKKYFQSISIITFALSTILFFLLYPMQCTLFSIVRFAILPISALFTFIFIIGGLQNSFLEKILDYFGKESLPIYMIHVFVYNILLMIIQKLQMPLDISSGIISLLLTTAITVLIIFLCKKINIYRYIFQ